MKSSSCFNFNRRCHHVLTVKLIYFKLIKKSFFKRSNVGTKMWFKLLSSSRPFAIQDLRWLAFSIWIIGSINFSFGTANCGPDSLKTGVQIIGHCKANENEVCTAHCKNKDATIWKKQVRCINGKWSPTPLCLNRKTARQTNDNYFSRHKPQKRKTEVQSLEMVDCDKFNINDTFGAKKICFKITERIIKERKCPELRHLRLSIDSCSREPNSVCKVSCGKEYTMLRCLASGKWSHIPKCKNLPLKICPVPKIGTLLHCNRTEGDTCKFRCPNASTEVEVTCLPSGSWSLAVSLEDVPDILLRCPCPPPALPDEMVTTEDCNRKAQGEKCLLGCRKHFALIGNQEIVCKEDLTWSPFPVCSDKTCPFPHLEEPLALTQDYVSKLAEEICQLRCKEPFRIVGEPYIRCINGTHWTSMPHCVCPPPVLFSGIVQTKENCEEKGVGTTCELECRDNFSLPEVNYITCQNNGSWSPVPSCKKNTCTLPDLPRTTLDFKEDCTSKRIGDSCRLGCLKVSETYDIVCLNNTHWSTFPKCSCPSPSFSSSVKIEETCLDKKPGEKCEISCRNVPALKTRMYVTCKSNSEWSNEPSCEEIACPKPTLPSYLRFDEDCSHKGRDDRCRLVCTTGGKIVGEEYITCREGMQWSDFPKCTCPKLYINSDLIVLEDCSFKTPHETCKVKCPESLSLSGQNFLICQTDTTWSEQPSCIKNRCPVPDLPPHLRLDAECREKTIGSTCEVFCRNAESVVGQNIITCLNDLKWSPFPLCSCPEPRNTHDLEVVGTCQNSQPDSECKLTCRGYLKLQGSPYIRCLQNGTWSKFPVCSGGACSVPEAPENMLIVEPCTSKELGDKCKITCKTGGTLHGNDFIECMSETRWSDYPICACPKPVLTNRLKLVAECDVVTPGKKCYLKCENNVAITGRDFITCGNDFQWSDMPSCDKVFCGAPTLSPFLEAGASCASKEPGDECLVSCKEGGKMFGSPFIKCLNRTKWSQAPDCGCHEPLLVSENLEKAEDCSRKKINDKCSLRCTNGKKLEKAYITCLNNTRWSSQPTCKVQRCPEPFFPEGIFKTKEDCSSKMVGETCALNCTENGRMIGPGVIECLNGSQWSKFPDCACPDLSLPKTLAFVGDCVNKTRGMQCEVACKGLKQRISVNPGENKITCLRDFSWSPLPKCTCPSLDPKSNLNGYCDDVLPGMKCSVTCKDEFATAARDFISCNNDSEWDDVKSVCKKVKCQNTSFSSPSDYVGQCVNKLAGDRCRLRCKGRGIFLERMNEIRCEKSGQWSKPRKCVCSSVLALPGLKIGEMCSNKGRGDTCKIQCQNGVNLGDRGFIRCNDDFRWTPAPSCEANYCTAPQLPSGIRVIEGNCTRLKVNESCKLQCINKGVMNGLDTLTCGADRKLSKLPTCTCQEPYVTPDLRAYTSCAGREINDSCALYCVTQPRIAHYINCLMHENWMWSRIPVCPCASPRNLHRFVTLQEDCLADTIPVNTKCELKCINFGKLIRGDSITCLPGGEWTPSPICACAPPGTSSTRETFLDLSQCNRVLPGGTCQVTCTRGKIDKPFMQCNATHYWDAFPICKIVCPNPKDLLARNNIALGDECNRVEEYIAGLVCPIKCLNGGIYPLPASTECRMDSTWSVTNANCPCAPPSVPNVFKPNIMEHDLCRKKYKGHKCGFACTEPGKQILDDKQYLVCHGDSWTGTLSCGDARVCPMVIVQSPYQTAEDCDRKRYFQSCYLSLDPGFRFKTKVNYLNCDDGKWSSWPEIERVGAPPVQCTKPHVTDALLMWPSECNNRAENDNCVLRCRNNGVFKDVKTYEFRITCVRGPQNRAEWSSFPVCFCPPYQFGREHAPAQQDKCDQKRAGESCNLYCYREQKWTTVTCTTYGSWTAPVCGRARRTADVPDAGNSGETKKRTRKEVIPDLPYLRDLNSRYPRIIYWFE